MSRNRAKIATDDKNSVQLYDDGKHDDANMQKNHKCQYTCSFKAGTVSHPVHHHPSSMFRAIGSGNMSGGE